MKKGIFTLLLAFSLAFASNTKEKIKDSKNSLRSTQAMSEQLSKKLDDLAGDRKWREKTAWHKRRYHKFKRSNFSS